MTLTPPGPPLHATWVFTSPLPAVFTKPVRHYIVFFVNAKFAKQEQSLIQRWNLALPGIFWLVTDIVILHLAIWAWQQRNLFYLQRGTGCGYWAIQTNALKIGAEEVYIEDARNAQNTTEALKHDRRILKHDCSIMHARMHPCMHACMHAHMHACMHPCTHACIMHAQILLTVATFIGHLWVV